MTYASLQADHLPVPSGVILPSHVLEMVARVDPSLAAHQFRVALLAGGVAKELELSPEESTLALQGGMVHDVGKMAEGVAAVMELPRKLTSDEDAVARLHPNFGATILTRLGIQRGIVDVAQMHHEHLDGSGYPDGLSGEDIPRYVQCVTAADIFAALTEWNRYYRRPSPANTAFGEMFAMGSRGELDPQIVAALSRFVVRRSPDVSQSTIERAMRRIPDESDIRAGFKNGWNYLIAQFTTSVNSVSSSRN
ncbi:MAG: HD domain-containing phosphohydrolase [Candidatus Gracilibacteria bacterium]